MDNSSYSFESVWVDLQETGAMIEQSCAMNAQIINKKWKNYYD